MTEPTMCPVKYTKWNCDEWENCENQKWYCQDDYVSCVDFSLWFWKRVSWVLANELKSAMKESGKLPLSDFA